MAVSDLTKAERSHYEEYVNLRSISDWPGFTPDQAERKEAARAWLDAKRKAIWHEGQDSGWDKRDRRSRYNTLHPDNLNSASPTHEYRLPAGTCTPTEKALIEEREVWIVVQSQNEAQKARKQACTDELVHRRKQLYHLGQDDGWDQHSRRRRYENLCVATKHGRVWDEYAKSHDRYGEPKDKQSARDKAVTLARSHIGTVEHPSGSNRGPKISDWQKRVLGSDGYPWCACFVTCMAWDAGVKGSSSAGVQVIVNMAKAGRGMFRGWTTDPRKVRKGDFAIVGCTSCHIELVASEADPYSTIGGNTSSGSSGSQYNGGGVFARDRRGEIVGWARVDYPG